MHLVTTSDLIPAALQPLTSLPLALVYSIRQFPASARDSHWWLNDAPYPIILLRGALFKKTETSCPLRLVRYSVQSACYSKDELVHAII